MNKYIRYFLRRNKIYRGNLKSTYKNWNVLPCDELYLNKISNKQRIEHCALMTEKIIFHTYWHGDFGLKQSFSIKSFLCTQDLRNTELWLWLDASNGYSQLLENKYLLELKDKIKILPWNIEEEIFDTPFQNIKSFLLKDKPLPARGDDFRIIALYKFGGVYFDLDIMFLKDFSSLLRGHEFVYAWEYQPYANSAVIYLRKNSFLTIYLMKKMMKRKEAMPWVLFDYKDNKLANLRNYPCTYFDPLWGGYSEDMPFDNFDYFFKRFDSDFVRDPRIKSYKDFFPAAFTYHWHNRWDMEEHPDSYFGIFNAEYNKLLLL
ncbi:glycosyltransferase [Bacteroides faecium]|uniref:Glycosyl transferase n=1 Tax=Bacteroides faecium TaxID=2715212 RepID=A0A6H0KT78_9BACE|nr:glycosyltransferase [Bacteroides faecium]QIU96552.1 hypothetical protein BacF7301_21410 [Bacteroides faecium]